MSQHTFRRLVAMALTGFALVFALMTLDDPTWFQPISTNDETTSNLGLTIAVYIVIFGFWVAQIAGLIGWNSDTDALT